MNREQVSGRWNVLKGKIKTKWGKLTDDDLAKYEGHRDRIIGRIQELYGDKRADIERDFDELDREKR